MSRFAGIVLALAVLVGVASAQGLQITTPGELQRGVQSVLYNNSLTAIGGQSPYTWSLTTGGTGLPPGITLQSNGQITGFTATPNTYTFRVIVTDSTVSSPQSQLGDFTLIINPTLVITTGSPLPNGVRAAPYTGVTLASTGGQPAVTWMLDPMSSMPPGLTLNSNGAITGTPTVVGSYDIEVLATDSATAPSTQVKFQSFALTITEPVFTITTDATLPTGTVATQYTQALAAANGTPPYANWAITAGALPAGLALTQSTGIISGTPTTPGTFNFTVQLRDSESEPRIASKAFSLTINPAGPNPLVITTSNPLMSGNEQLPYTQALSASGGTPPYVNWRIAFGGGTLPNGLSLNSTTGVIAGTPTVSGTFTFAIVVSDSAQTPANASKVFTIEVGSGDLRIETVSPLNTGNVGTAYSHTITAGGGFPPYRNWSVLSGALPPGLSLNEASGVLAGTPTAAGAYDFTVAVDDSSSNGNLQSAQKPFRLTILPGTFTITTQSPLPGGTLNGPYSATFAATGGESPYVNWTVSAGALPFGLTLNAFTGQLAGIPTQNGIFNFTVQVQDSTATPVTASKAFSLTINGGPITIITNSPLPGGNTGTSYSQTLAASGGVPPYTNWIVSSGTLPLGLTLNASTGVLSGVPTVAGTTTFTVTVHDSTPSNGDPTGSKAFSLTINAPVALSIVTASPLPGGSLTNAYSQTLTATGGLAPYSNWIVTAGVLPAGLSLNAASGVISGTPTATGAFNFTVQVRDANSTPQTASKAFSLSIAATAPVITTLSPLTSGSTGQLYTTNFNSTGGTAPFTWSFATGALPSGIALNSEGVLFGTTTQSGNFTFGVRVTDASNLGDTKTYSLRINPFTLTITTASPLPNGTVNAVYSQVFAATGGSLPYSWAVETGVLPAGLTLTSSGLLSGTPTQQGNFEFVVAVTDAEEFTAYKHFRLTIAAAIAPVNITTGSPLPPGTVGLPYNLTFAATGGTAPYSWSLGETSSLPPGLTLTATGLLSGIPTTAGSYTFDLEARGSGPQQFGTKTFTLQIQLVPLAISTGSPLSGATINNSYSQVIAASGGLPPYAWQLVSGALPQGITFSAAGVLSGTPTQSGLFTFTVRVRDALFTQVDKTFTLAVDAGLPIITTTTLPAGPALQIYSFQLTAAGGTPPYTWAIASGSLPSGFALTTGGLVFGTGGDASSATFVARVNDSNGRSSTKPFTLVVSSREEPSTSALEIATLSLPDGTVGKIYGMQFAARNGSPPYRWSFSGLPEGIEGGSEGDLLGTPRRSGTFGVQVTVQDGSRTQTTGLFTLVIQPSAVVITTERAPDGRVNESYSTGFTATGGLPPYRFSVASGALPSGLALSANGLLTGIPGEAGSYQFSIQAVDSLGERGTRGYSIVIKPPPLAITTSSLGNGTVGNTFNGSLAATGGTPPYRWGASGLPDGLGVDQNTGAITGIPTKNGTFAVSATVTDQSNENASRSYSIEITTVLVITTTSVGNMVVDAPVSTALSATGGLLPYSWSLLNGSLPNGVGLSADGIISGTPTTLGDSNFTVQVADANGITTSKAFSVRVVAPLVITTEILPSASFGVPYSASLAATGGTPPYQWSVASGNLPGGLQLSSTGAITGTPTVGGTFTFTVQVGDSTMRFFATRRAFTMVVALPDVSGITITVPANPQPAQQPPVSLQISSPYPVDLTGTLVLSFAPNAANNADDPAIQFSTGGRSAPFTIPAGQTQAVFQVPNLMIQTGTTAGTITLTASMNAGGSPISCNCQLTQTIIIPRTAPVITSLRVTRTATGFNVLVTGYSTSREVTQGTFRFAGATALQTTELTVPLTTAFNSWFQSAASNSFGGQFSLTIPFTIQGDTSTVNSVTVTLTNATGSSQPSTTTF